jgi:DNA-binding transcriptional MerR regulator
MTIGQLALHPREPVKALHYWTDLGLLAAERSVNACRYYGAEDADRAGRLERAKAQPLPTCEGQGCIYLA